MTARRELHDDVHQHPAGMRCVACIVAGIEVTPTEEQAARVSLVGRKCGRAHESHRPRDAAPFTTYPTKGAS